MEQTNLCPLVFLFVCVGALLGFSLGKIWTDTRNYENQFEHTTFAVVGHEQNVKTCCEIGRCEGGCSPLLLPNTSCDAMIVDGAGGYCDAGYLCCNFIVTDTGGRQCTQSTDHQVCQSVCSTCYSGTLDVQYKVGGTGVQDGTWSSDVCFGDPHCTDRFFEEYPINSTNDGWYIKNNPSVIGVNSPMPSYEWTGGDIVGIVVFGILVILALYLLYLHKR
eukprot:GILJ01025930.1.p1 GENE.GILJ01025930.1~~GILJ01025930.1.p1  ORF type:complete len:219 (+),score=13.78 GILJ01025930.1:3-659(+)